MSGRVDRLEASNRAVQMRVTTELLAVREAVQDVSSLLRSQVAVSDQVRRHDTAIADLETRVGKLEEGAGQR